MLRLLIVSLMLVFVSCGKNEGFRPAGPIYVPPVAPGGYMPPVGGGYGGGYGGGGYAPTFNPQMPQGYPNQYYPFLPVDNYFRQNQQMQQYWQQMWGRWQMYAQQRQYYVYDFVPFWFEFAAYEWGGSSYSPMYNWFNDNVYVWVNASTQFPSNANPTQYWSPYAGMPYGW